MSKSGAVCFNRDPRWRYHPRRPGVTRRTSRVSRQDKGKVGNTCAAVLPVSFLDASAVGTRPAGKVLTLNALGPVNPGCVGLPSPAPACGRGVLLSTAGLPPVRVAGAVPTWIADIKPRVVVRAGVFLTACLHAVRRARLVARLCRHDPPGGVGLCMVPGGTALRRRAGVWQVVTRGKGRTVLRSWTATQNVNPAVATPPPVDADTGVEPATFGL